MKKDRLLLLLLAVLLAVFGLGVGRLFQLRFAVGDIYPPYSSLRADPLGTKALFASLEGLRGVTVQRFSEPLDKLREGRGTTLFVFGAQAFDMDYSTEEEYKKLEQFMFDGGRIVISFAPVNTRPWAARRAQAKEEQKTKDKRAGKPKQNPDEPEDEESMPRKRKPLAGDEEDLPGMKLVPLRDRWNVGFDYEDLPKDGEDVYQSVLARRKADSDLPASIAWHTALYFQRPGANWTVIYAREDHPVLIERRFGSGSLVFSADSYFVSNEAMRKERHPKLLTWLAGRSTTVLFDETHLGVLEEPGVAALVAKYRLHGLALGLALLAGLFVWKNTTSFVPPFDEDIVEIRSDAVVGRDSAAGFVNLLRRGIPSAEVLSVCFLEWKKARAHGRADLSARTERMAAVVAEEQAKSERARNPVESYRRIASILTERK
jgi:hypothetical protein